MIIFCTKPECSRYTGFMTSKHTAQNTDAILIALVIGCAVMALPAALLLVQIGGTLAFGHGVVPAEVFFAATALALLVPVLAAIGMDMVRVLLDSRTFATVSRKHSLAPSSFLSAVMALASPPPRAGL